MVRRRWRENMKVEIFTFGWKFEQFVAAGAFWLIGIGEMVIIFSRSKRGKNEFIGKKMREV